MLRELIIREKEKDLKRQQKFSFLGVLSNNYIQSYQNTYILELPGIGISLVDNEPSE